MATIPGKKYDPEFRGNPDMSGATPDPKALSPEEDAAKYGERGLRGVPIRSDVVARGMRRASDDELKALMESPAVMADEGLKSEAERLARERGMLREAEPEAPVMAEADIAPQPEPEKRGATFNPFSLFISSAAAADLGNQYVEERAEADRRANDPDAWFDSLLDQGGQSGQTAPDAVADTEGGQGADQAPPAAPVKVASPLERWVGATLTALIPISEIRGRADALSRDAAVDVGRGVVEAPGAVVRGSSAAVENTLETLDGLAEWLNENVADLKIPVPDWVPEWINNPLQAGADVAEGAKNIFGERESTTGRAVEFISQWLTSQALAGKITRAFGMPRGALKRILDAGLGGGAGFDPAQDRLSNVISEMAPNPLTDWLKADKDDPELLGRVKAGLEVAGLQAVSEGVILGLKTLKGARSAAQAGAQPAAAIDDVIDETGAPARDVLRLDPPVTLSDDLADKAAKFLSGEIDDAPIQVNFARFEGTESVRKAIIDISKQLPEQKTISMETTLKAAREMGLTPDQLTSMEGTLFDRRQIMAGWMMFRSSAGELAKLAETARRSGAPKDVATFNAAFQVTHGILQTVKGQSSDIARALQIHNALRKSEPEMVKALQGLIDEAGGSEVALDMATRVAALADPSRAAEFIAQVGARPTRDRIVYAWSNILLSNPTSHVANVADTSLATFLQVPETWFASKIGTDVAKGEATARLYGITQGMKDGLRTAARALKTGESQFKIGTRVEGLTAQPLAASDDLVKSGIMRQAGDYLKMLLPTRIMMAGDELTKVMNYRGELHALAWRNAVQQGLDPKAAALAAQRMVESPPQSLIAMAEAQALKGTFNESLEGTARAMAQMIDKANVAGIPVGRLIVPFVRTPVNLVRWTAHRTPLAFLSPKIQAELAAGGATRDLALARVATGSTIAAAFADLTMQGRITGAGPKDPGLRSALMRTGWQPYSFHYGDTWISYNRSGTIGMLIGLAADSTELITGVYTREKDTINFDGEPVEDSAAAVVVFPFAGAVLNKTWTSGAAELIDSLADPTRKGESYIRRIAGSVVPAGVGALERSLDPEIRRAETTLEAIRARIPGTSSGLEPRLNLWGEKLIDENGIYNLFLPTRISSEKGGEIDKEILRLKIEPGPPKQIQSFGRSNVDADIKLSTKQHNRLIALSGNELKLPSIPGMKPMGAKETLEAIVTGKAGALSKQYEQASDDRREIVIRDVLSKYRQAAKATLMQEDDRLRELVTQTLQKRAGDLRAPRAAP